MEGGKGKPRRKQASINPYSSIHRARAGQRTRGDSAGMMADGRRLLVSLVLFIIVMAASAGSKGVAAFEIPRGAPAFGVRTGAPAEYCYRFGSVIAPFYLGTAAAIHLGNTNSCIAGYDFDRGTGTRTGSSSYDYQFCISSWVAVTENGTTITGEAAMNHAAVSPGTAISGFVRLLFRRLESDVMKRAMELMPYNFTEKLGWAAIKVETTAEQKDGAVFAVADLAGALISELKHKAEAHLGHEVRHSVIAVPRHLTYTGRRDVASAASLHAGFRGVRAIDQQIAAAAAYGHHTEQGDRKAILVFRLGGRTSDATIFKFIDGTARYVKAQDDYFLGGDDFTARIVDYMAELIKQQHQWDIRQQDSKALLRLRVACEHAKKALSEQEETLVQVDSLVDGAVSFSAPLTRAKFEELNHDLFDRAMALVDGVVKGALTRSGGHPPGLDSRKDMVHEIVLVGGSARIPKLRQLVTDYFRGREPNNRYRVEPEKASIHGAAILSRPEAARYLEECFHFL